MKILFIGDPHIKTDNHEEIDILVSELKKICESNHIDYIIIGGDLMHYHERIFTQALNKSLEFVTFLTTFAPVYILVGNHDMINNQQFLTSNHWLNVFSHCKNVKIVEKPIVLTEMEKTVSTFTFLMCPYVYPGRFIEAIETVSKDKDWKTYNVIFAHQEFKGCKMGAIVSKDGDEWSEDFPQIISGHIHDNQTPQKNIYYPGSPLQHAFGDTDKRVVCIIDEKGVITNIDLDVPKKTIIKKTVSDISKVNSKDLHSHLKIKLTATPEEFKAFKQTQQYKECIEKGVKIQLDVKTMKREESSNIIEQTNFRLLLQNLVETDGDSLLKKIYMDILS